MRRVVIVHLRRPNSADPRESRSDPFYEFGSFGCTGCHKSNLMNPRRAHELEGARIAFAQGGALGFRLVHLTPPVSVVEHRDRCELVWEPADRPFRYAAAPLLFGPDGASDFSGLVGMLRDVLRTSWPARFSSRFRSRREPLPAAVGAQLARIFDRRRARATSEELATTYIDALPAPPNQPDEFRELTLARLREQAGGARKRRRSRCAF